MVVEKFISHRSVAIDDAIELMALVRPLRTGERECEAMATDEADGYDLVCSRVEGHLGPHVAASAFDHNGADDFCAAWPAEVRS